MKGHRVTGYRNLCQYVLGNSKLFFAFCRKWLKVAQKNSLRLRGVLGLTIESFQKVTKIQNDGNHPKPHTVIPNTFGTQGTKMIQGNIICSQILML